MSESDLMDNLDVPESPQHPCQCSAINNTDSTRMLRDKTEKSMDSIRISNSPDLTRSLETLQNVFEPIRRLDSPQPDNSQINLDNTRNTDLLDHQTDISPNSRSMTSQSSILSRHGPRNMDLCRNLAFEAARRIQEGSSLQDKQHSLTSSPSPLLEMTSKVLDKQLEDHINLSQKQNSGKDKLKNIQQILNPYQHHHEPAMMDRNIHGHYHGDIHAHLHKHTDNFRNSTNLDTTESLMGFQPHQRQHTHHHHNSVKTNIAHHHSSGAHHTYAQGMIGHHHGNLTTTSHIHGNSGPLSAPGWFLFFFLFL